ncbi:MAG: DUF6498-containing protein [Chromatiales bacterium]|jgi:hypothetical protein|nr:DUF6498-containing protein [Chromatiales bacterium]MDX9766302.1 DUF6498-containing protein [Ectothiorhodospiraceae bacterium]
MKGDDRLPLLALLVANLLPLFGVLGFGWDVGGLLVLYWLENLVVGAYTLLRMLHAGGWFAVFPGLFFAFHYGAFCGGHGLFLMLFLGDGDGIMPTHGDDWPGPLVFIQMLVRVIEAVAEQAPEHFWLPLFGLAVSHGISLLVHHVFGHEDAGRSPQRIMMDPYGRIVVMHLAIIAGGMAVMALGSPLPMLLILIVLKIGFDVALHRRAHARRAPAS